MYIIAPENREALMKTLADMNARYSEEWKCPTSYLSKANYHTRLARSEVHSTTEAFRYAAALLLTGEESDRRRAEEVLWHVASLQDTDPTNATYGIWSWYMEEPLSQMSPPDWNWADFCGREILKVLEHHGDCISHSLYVFLEDALRHACLSIYRRNVRFSYTNISIMGAYVTLHAGQLLSWPWLFGYGAQRLKKQWEFAMKTGSFSEYNSATYTRVAIECLTCIHDVIRDPDVLRMADDLLDLAWRTVAAHFHAPTKQWCGPNARSYMWLTDAETLSFLEEGLERTVPLAGDAYTFTPDWAYMRLRCPEKYRGAFTACTPHDEALSFRVMGAFVEALEDAYALCHMEEDYALASWGVSTTWNQRRNLLGYWGGRETRFINASILHNRYDFSSGLLTTAQKDGHALVIADMVSDGGDTHCNLDMIKNETIRAYDLRVRIEIGGCYDGRWEVDGDTAVFTDSVRRIVVRLKDASFDGHRPRFAVTDSEEESALLETHADLHRRFIPADREALRRQVTTQNSASLQQEVSRSYLDVVWYEGEEKEINLSKLKDAFAVLYVSMDGVLPRALDARVENGMVYASAELEDHMLSVRAPAKCVSRFDFAAAHQVQQDRRKR